MSVSEKDILIVGAGILGLSSAWYLAERGARVTVLDREPIKDAASCGNAGLISLGHPPLTRPGVSVQGLKWMFDKRSPLYIKPRLDGDLARWLWTFHRHCNQTHYEGTMEVLCELGRLVADCASNRFSPRPRSTATGSSRGWDDVCMHKSRASTTPRRRRRSSVTSGFIRSASTATNFAPGAPYTDDVVRRDPFEDSATLSPQAFIAGLARELQARGVTVRTDCRQENPAQTTRPRRRRASKAARN